MLLVPADGTLSQRALREPEFAPLPQAPRAAEPRQQHPAPVEQAQPETTIPPAHTIDDRNFDIAAQCVVLQAVVADDHITVVVFQ